MRRFFFDPARRRGDRVRLDAVESRHIVKVLRLSAGDPVELLDGSGAVYPATVVSTERAVELELGERLEFVEDSGTPLFLFQSILKGEKMDVVVQKSTELGVTRLQPVQTARSQGGSDDARKRERWQRIGLAACKQCLRPRLMEVAVPLAVNDFQFDLPEGTLKLFFYEEEREVGLREVAGELAAAPAVALFIGPEGGLTPAEVEAARAAGWRTVGLGWRILRAETATISTLALVQYLCGNM